MVTVTVSLDAGDEELIVTVANFGVSIARLREALSCKMSLYVLGTAPEQIWIRKLLLENLPVVV